jgi:hypothetical protein
VARVGDAAGLVPAPRTTGRSFRPRRRGRCCRRRRSGTAGTPHQRLRARNAKQRTQSYVKLQQEINNDEHKRNDMIERRGRKGAPFRRRKAKQAAAKRDSMVAAPWQQIDDHNCKQGGCEWRWHPAHNLFIERNEMDRYLLNSAGHSLTVPSALLVCCYATAARSQQTLPAVGRPPSYIFGSLLR